MKQSPNRKLLILYSELAGYTVACLNYFATVHPDVEIHLVSWPVNPEAPFRFQIAETIKKYDRKKLDDRSLNDLVTAIKPDLILCSGWMDKAYLNAVKSRSSESRATLLMDNRWSGSMKQRAATLLAPFMITRHFDYAWVPGDDQKFYATKLGFRPEKIRTGFYSGDTNLFAIKEPRQQCPHRFIYAGRYYDFKGVRELWSEFIKFSEVSRSDWELWCYGIGDIEPVTHPKIKHFGFQQPEQLANEVKDGGVFVLPSKFEPWGVVVHEFAAAGFPLLLSSDVGAAAQFLQDGVNGYKFNIHQKGDLQNAFQKIAESPQEELLKMSRESARLGASVNPETWSKTLYDLLKDN